MRTYIYVDGFNLYYRALKGTNFKWLDLDGLFADILQSHHEILKIKYFTARIRPLLQDKSKHIRQDTYLLALASGSPKIEIFYGHFLTNKVRMPLANPGCGSKTVEVIKTEEKGSDVNLAAHLISDAWLDVFDCAAIVSNDGDLAGAMELVKKHHTDKMLGLITPVNNPSAKLSTHADFIKRIRKGVLGKNQFPSPLPGTNITKPKHWQLDGAAGED